MLGGITRDLGEMLTKLSGREFTCEYKYDGNDCTKLLLKFYFLFANKLVQANEHKSIVIQQAKLQSSLVILK